MSVVVLETELKTEAIKGYLVKLFQLTEESNGNLLTCTEITSPTIPLLTVCMSLRRGFPSPVTLRTV